MSPNRDALDRFYAAFARRDHAAMTPLYAPDATFEDEVFTLRGKEIGAMWHMLCENARDFSLEYRDVEADDARGRAHWEAKYTFSATGRPVHNVIDAEVGFREGLIATHRDRFDFGRWSRQAIGMPAVLLGWTPLIRNKVRATAAKNLAAFIAKHPEYQLGLEHHPDGHAIGGRRPEGGVVQGRVVLREAQ
jgi:ketosteroid isomerase-like protein